MDNEETNLPAIQEPTNHQVDTYLAGWMGFKIVPVADFGELMQYPYLQPQRTLFLLDNRLWIAFNENTWKEWSPTEHGSWMIYAITHFRIDYPDANPHTISRPTTSPHTAVIHNGTSEIYGMGPTIHCAVAKAMYAFLRSPAAEEASHATPDV
jgi:hypothetical protein